MLKIFKYCRNKYGDWQFHLVFTISLLQEALRLHPHIRELDRPNLKQSCQACEFASQPAIKSVHLFGNPYDRFTLQEQPAPGGTKPSLVIIACLFLYFMGDYSVSFSFVFPLFKELFLMVRICSHWEQTHSLNGSPI